MWLKRCVKPQKPKKSKFVQNLSFRLENSHFASCIVNNIVDTRSIMPDTHPQPSATARDLVRGAFDTHVHINPDVIPRRISDLELAQRFFELGMAGFVLKSHYTSTAERAKTVTAAVTGGVVAVGALVLNHGVGGMNPIAVEIAAREGARVVWMPTVDAANEARELEALQNSKLPLWAVFQAELRQQGYGVKPVAVVADGQVLPETEQVLRVIANHNLVLATGHLGRDEIFTVVDAALGLGVKNIVITHPDYPTQDLSHHDQAALAERGALLERCIAPCYSGKISFEKMFAAIKATGAAHSVLSTDLGQPKNLPVEDGLPLVVDLMLEAGFATNEIQIMAVDNTRRVAGATV
jgi:Family of unknown function (DUF6282)